MDHLICVFLASVDNGDNERNITERGDYGRPTSDGNASPL